MKKDSARAEVGKAAALETPSTVEDLQIGSSLSALQPLTLAG